MECTFRWYGLPEDTHTGRQVRADPSWCRSVGLGGSERSPTLLSWMLFWGPAPCRQPLQTGNGLPHLLLSSVHILYPPHPAAAPPGTRGVLAVWPGCGVGGEHPAPRGEASGGWVLESSLLGPSSGSSLDLADPARRPAPQSGLSLESTAMAPQRSAPPSAARPRAVSPCCTASQPPTNQPTHPPPHSSPSQYVLPPREFGSGSSSKLGEDVFVCEYQYDEAWQASCCWVFRHLGGTSPRLGSSHFTSGFISSTLCARGRRPRLLLLLTVLLNHPPPCLPQRFRRLSEFDSESEDGGAWAPNATGPAAAASSDGPTAAEAAFEAVSLAPGEDALLVQVAAPAQSWGLIELEVSAGERLGRGAQNWRQCGDGACMCAFATNSHSSWQPPSLHLLLLHHTAAGSLLSRAVPLLVLPAAAEAAAKELAAGLAGLPPSEAASLLLHLGFAMQAAEQGARLQPAAVQRVSRLACALALFCGERGWVSAARLLLPAIALAAQPAEGSSHSTLRVAASCKDDLPGCSAAAAAAGLRACKGVAPDQQERLSLMLARMAAKDAEDAEDAEAAQQQQQQAPAQLVSPLSDWFWVGCNLAAGAAAVVLLVRNLAMEGMP